MKLTYVGDVPGHQDPGDVYLIPRYRYSTREDILKALVFAVTYDHQQKGLPVPIVTCEGLPSATNHLQGWYMAFKIERTP